MHQKLLFFLISLSLAFSGAAMPGAAVYDVTKFDRISLTTKTTDERQAVSGYDLIKCSFNNNKIPDQILDKSLIISK